MNRIARLFAVGFTTVVLLTGSTLSAAAQSTGACPFASDAAVAQALGPGAYGQQFPSGSGDSPLCAIVGATPSPILVTHMINVVPSGDPAGPEELARTVQGLPQGASGNTLQAAAVPGLGDSALFLSGGSAGGAQGAMLIVQSGTDTFTFNLKDPPSNAQATLTALAQAVLASLAQ